MFKSICVLNSLRCGRSVSSISRPLSNYGWQIEKYHIDEEFGQDQVQYNPQMRRPVIYNPTDLLVEVKAASMNPLDLLMIQGYGREIIDSLNVVTQSTKCKLSYDKFPLVLGRDFSGVVRSTGAAVTKFQVGDQIWGSLSPFKQGSHCKFLVASENELSLKPNNLSFEEAASIPYAALTAWSALFKFGNFSTRDSSSKRILVLGASGGLGTFTIQLLKALGCSHLTVTCSSDAKEFIKQIADVNEIYDYRNDLDRLFSEKEGFFDYVLDFSSSPTGQNELKLLRLLKRSPCSYYVTPRSPLLKNADQSGLCLGLLKSLKSAGELTWNGLQMGTNARWAYYEANQSALERIKELCESGRIKPTVQQVFDLEQLPLAYETMSKGHLRGKLVISIP